MKKPEWNYFNILAIGHAGDGGPSWGRYRRLTLTQESVVLPVSQSLSSMLLSAPGFPAAAAAAAKSLQSCQTVWPPRGQPTRLPHPWDFPGKNTGVGCHCLLCLASLAGTISNNTARLERGNKVLLRLSGLYCMWLSPLSRLYKLLRFWEWMQRVTVLGHPSKKVRLLNLPPTNLDWLTSTFCLFLPSVQGILFGISLMELSAFWTNNRLLMWEC